MGLIEAYREYRNGLLLACSVVAVVLCAVVYTGVFGVSNVPGHQMQVIQFVLAISASIVFAYAIRPGKFRAGWLLWWIPPILTMVSLPFQALLPNLIANDTTALMQVVFFLTLTWVTVLAAPLTWFAVYLPIEFLVRVVRGERNLAVPRLVWGLAIGAVTLGGVLLTVLLASPNSVLLIPRVLAFTASRYPNLGAIMELVLLFGPMILGLLVLVLLTITLLKKGGSGRLIDAFVLSVPPLEQAWQDRHDVVPSPKSVYPPRAPSAWAWWNPVRLWRDVPGAVLIAISTVVVAFAVAIVGNSRVYIHHLVMPFYVYIGPLTWSVALTALSGVVLAMILNGRHFRSLWLMGWIALIVTVIIGIWLMATDPTVGGFELFMFGFIAVISTALSCLTWLFLVVPVQLIVTSVLGLASQGSKPWSTLLLGLCLGAGGVGILSGFYAVDLPLGANEAQRQQAIIAALLDIPGDYSVLSETALWVARLSIAAMIIFGLSARGVAGGKGELQNELSESALGPRSQDSGN